MDTSEVIAVGVSAHGAYTTRVPPNYMIDDLGFPMVVYHKDGVSTHAFRFADDEDIHAENAWGAYIRAPLIGHYGWPSEQLRNQMYGWDFGSASLAITDDHFLGEVTKAKPDRQTVPILAGFDVTYDDPGTNNI